MQRSASGWSPTGAFQLRTTACSCARAGRWCSWIPGLVHTTTRSGARGAGLAPEDVDVVVVTHGHLDHIGGLSRDGAPRFPRARHVVARLEWELWTGDGRLTDAETVAHAQIPPLDEAGVIELVEPPVEVVDGVRLLPAPGHSPGQVAVELGAAALYLADVVIDELHAEHPDWSMQFDADPLVAVETRRQLLGRAADEDLLVVASHLPGPARVERAGDGFRFVA
jgi:glyoxylase-like metal-dependent hydrolase (beta-lactamase superfamily II)